MVVEIDQYGMRGSWDKSKGFRFNVEGKMLFNSNKYKIKEVDKKYVTLVKILKHILFNSNNKIVET